MKKKIYQWHRSLSLVIALPVLAWALSGIMHPVMTNIRPRIATQGIAALPVDSSAIRVSLEQALAQNGVDSFHAFRLVHIDTSWFYQVQQRYNAEPVYISTRTGKLLKRGDWLYAQYLARQFLEGSRQKQPQQAAAPVHDCCDAAALCVLADTTGSQVTAAVRLTQFDNEYKSINRLLPVYKVSFDRPDGIRVYVETMQDRFAFAMDNRRALLDTIFRLVHTWGWLSFLGNGKYLVEFLLAALAFITALMGLYIFFTTRSKAVPGNGMVKARRRHRFTAIAAALFTLLFTFSGAYHALYKLKEDTRDRFYTTARFAVKDIRFQLPQLLSAAKQPVRNIGLVSVNGQPYWQVCLLPKANEQGRATGQDLMKSMQAAAPPVLYLTMDNRHFLPGGEAGYAQYLATLFSGRPATAIKATTLQTRFDDAYNFTDKRLPVWKISYPGNEHWYVETATGKLAARVNNSELAEGYSFALLHKHEFMAWGGKTLKDASTLFWASAQVVMVLFGLILYFKWRIKRNKYKAV